jgi:histidine ammonia-lyase
MPQRRTIVVDGESLTPEAVGLVAARQARARLAPAAAARMRAARAVVERAVAQGETTYGVNTGFGKLATVKIPAADLAALQLNLVRSHAAGVGPLAAPETVRALLLLRANVLARGTSGVRPVLARHLLAMLEHDLLPAVPEQGSVGASGDLAPLAHVALAAIGEGELLGPRGVVPARRALAAAGLQPPTLAAKEGLSLVNGTQFGAALATLALLRAENLARSADIAAALTIDVLLGSRRAFDRRIQAARPHPGQSVSAANLFALLGGSRLLASHAGCERVQDAYSMRCTPQVHGAARDALAQLRRVIAIEINASTDNPLVFARDRAILSGGNFHAAPLAAALDYACLAMTSLGAIVERRTDRLVNPLVSGLPAFLAARPGLESGLMMAQVTAAALVSECRTLAHPGSVDSIPTSGNQEDHVSMAPWCARKFREVLDRIEKLVAIELLAGVAALRFRRPLRSSAALEAVARSITRQVPLPAGDFPPHGSIEAIAALVRRGTIVEAARREGCPVR